MGNIITYNLLENNDEMLRKSAKIACNFWNRFLSPKLPVVIQLGLFHSFNNTVAQAYQPKENSYVSYGKVEFNTRYLVNYSSYQVASTIIHEIGHTLGIGWSKWNSLFDRRTGIFYSEAIKLVPELNGMHVETDYGVGTRYSHWDEKRYNEEIMTGIKDHKYEYVLPVTIDVMSIFGHEVLEKISQPISLKYLMRQMDYVEFTRQIDVASLSLDYDVDTEVFEEFYV